MHKCNYNVATHNRILQGCLYNKSSFTANLSRLLAYTWYILVVSHALVIYTDMYARILRPNGPWAWVYISGKSLVPMIQLLNEQFSIDGWHFTLLKPSWYMCYINVHLLPSDQSKHHTCTGMLESLFFTIIISSDILLFRYSS